MMFGVRRPPIPPTSVQVECPRCGAHNAVDTLRWQEPRTGQQLKDRYGMDTMQGLAVVLGSGLLSFLLAGFFFGPDSTFMALAMTAFISIGIITAYTLHTLNGHENAVRVHHYECQ